MDLIIGKHSIAEAIRNPLRTRFELVGVADSLKTFFNEYKDCKRPSIEIKSLSKTDFERSWEKILKEHDNQFLKCPSDVFLLSDEIFANDPSSALLELYKKPNSKILCLDSLTDVHNGAAIVRTAAFYGIDAVITSSKGAFSLSPQFFRVSSGGFEHLRFIRVASLSSTITKLKENNFLCIGLSDKATIDDSGIRNSQKLCLVVGSEDKGLSNAVERLLDHSICLVSPGPLKTLNASVAAAVAMERYFA